MSDDGPPTRGRPRKNPNRLAKWEPPDGWVRVVAWVAREDRQVLKKAAIEAEGSVAELIRSLARSIDEGAISPTDLMARWRHGAQTMQKIPTMFVRDDDFRVTPVVRPECTWVVEGEGTATEKLDGTNIRLTLRSGEVVRVEKRRNPTKTQKKKGIVDGWYVEAYDTDPADKWVFEAVRGTDTSGWPDGEHCCEALGPKIQGNPLELDAHVCVPFDLDAPTWREVPRDFDGLRGFLSEADSLYSDGAQPEGIVFHHPDGRRAKIKRRDFDLR